MPTGLAHRAKTAEASPTIMANQRAEELRRQGVDVVGLTVGEPDFPTPEFVRTAAKLALDQGHTKYTASAGIVELREAIAAKSRRENGIAAADAAHTLVTPAKHALYASIMATVEPGDEVLLPDPCFVSYAAQVKLAGGTPKWVPLAREDGYGIRAEAVAKAITPRTKAIMLCSPNNPTGMMDEPDELRAIVELAQEKDFWIVSDEMYEKIIYEGTHLSPASVPGGWEKTITINGLSKSHAMTGWRTGWLHAPSPVFEAIAKIQTQTITQVPTFVQHATLAALKGPTAPVTEMVASFRERRDLVVKECAQTPGFDLMKPKGAFYAWPRLDVGVDGDEFAKFLLEKAHVATVAGSAFGPSGKNHIRLSYATSPAKIQEAFRRIREWLPRLKPTATSSSRR